MPTVNELREERKVLHTQMVAILEAADKDKRALTSEERAEYDRIEADLDAKGEQIEQVEGDTQRRAKAAQLAEEFKQSAGRRTTQAATPIVTAKGGDGASVTDQSIADQVRNLCMTKGLSHREAFNEVATKSLDNAKMKAFEKYCLSGVTGMSPQERAAMQVDIDSVGGTLVVPEEFVARLIKFVDDSLYIRQFCTVLPLTNADSVGIPTWDTDPADADWTSELGTGDADSSAATGKRRLSPNPLAKSIRISKTLMRKSAIPIESLIRERLGYKFSVTEEKGFLTGTGANQPLGLFTASALGISTGRDMATGNSGTAITADNLINNKFNLKAPYMASPNTRWIFHRDAVRNIRKLKDGNGQYIWQAGLAGTPDTILEVPYLMSEFAPNTFTSGLYVGLIGDLTFYWIAESLRMEIQRLDELYAATNQVGFIGRMELDAMPVLEEAFSRVTLG
jgi:HK97 family phage major capsid protein